MPAIAPIAGKDLIPAIAILIGMAVRNLLGRPEAAKSGLAFALRAPLRLGIVLLGEPANAGRLLSLALILAGIVVFAHYPPLFEALLNWVDKGEKPTPASIATRCRALSSGR